MIRKTMPMHNLPHTANNTCRLPISANTNQEETMKATGIVRRIDDLGRVVIPKEIRRTLRIRMGDPSLITLTQDLVFCMSVESAAERYIGN